jgi:hypothetical protein
VAFVVISAALFVTFLALYARKVYRGDHDTAAGLGVVAPPSASVASATPVASETAAPTPSETAPVAPSATAIELDTPPAPSATTTATAAATAPATTVATNPTPPVNPNPNPNAGGGGGGAAGGNAAASDSLTTNAQTALENSNGGRAITLAVRATQQNPANADAWLTLGAAYTAVGRRGQAMGAYRSCARLAQAHPHVSECRALAGIE